MSPIHSNPRRSFWGTWQGVCVIGLAAAMTFFLFTEHTAHTLGMLPFAIFLLCPILHFFMHRGQGGHAAHDGKPDGTETEADRGKNADGLPDEPEPPRRGQQHGGGHQ